jgi:hypothetical protein
MDSQYYAALVDFLNCDLVKIILLNKIANEE